MEANAQLNRKVVLPRRRRAGGKRADGIGWNPCKGSMALLALMAGASSLPEETPVLFEAIQECQTALRISASLYEAKCDKMKPLNRE